MKTVPFAFPFHSVRHISCPEDQDNDRRVYVGQAPLGSIMELPTDENVRDYLLDAEGRKRRRPTQVHRAIRDTLENNPDCFSVLNSGITIVARACDIDEKKKILLLSRPSIINGSQTQGVIKDFAFEIAEESRTELLERTHIKFEIVVTSDESLIADISIARNFQNDVMTISIAGRLGQLDELDNAFQKRCPDKQLRKSETKLSDDYILTERLLQVIAALVPDDLCARQGEQNKVYTYSMKAKCLKEFREIYDRTKRTDDPERERYAQLYQFYLDICAEAWELYLKWKKHPGFSGTRLRSIERENGSIVDVPDGIVFPILASLSAFAVKTTKRGWTINVPASFSDEELIRSAKVAYTEIARSNPNVMGKSKACYSQLYQLTSVYKRLTK